MALEWEAGSLGLESLGVKAKGQKEPQSGWEEGRAQASVDKGSLRDVGPKSEDRGDSGVF